MSQIDSLAPSTGKNPLLRLVKVEGKTVAKLTVNQINRLGLKVGSTWDASTQDRADHLVIADKARRYAIGLLARRPYSRRDLVNRISNKFDAAAAEQIAEELTEKRLLDDEELARSLVRENRSRSATGPRLLRDKLRRRGVAENTITEAIAESDASYNTQEAIAQLIAKKLATRSFQQSDATARKRKLWGLLQRRGFNSDSIGQALDRFWDQIADSEPQ